MQNDVSAEKTPRVLRELFKRSPTLSSLSLEPDSGEPPLRQGPRSVQPLAGDADPNANRCS